MYATSKLIIPAKTAQDSPYVPKILIFLRPPSSLDKSSDMGSSLAPDSIMTDVSQQNLNESSITERYVKAADMDPSLPAQDSRTEIATTTLQDQVRGYRKRKLIGSFDNIDFEKRDSLLTKVNLKKIINMDTFEALPMNSRRRLLNLLPINDQTPSSSASVSTPGTDYWIHPTALNNEFLSKALQDYSVRQMNGEFSPRLTSRAGLRKSVRNRRRYSSPVLSPVSIKHSSTPLPQPPAITFKEEPNFTPVATTGSPLKTNGFDSTTSRLQAISTLQIAPAGKIVESNIKNEYFQDSASIKLDKDSKMIPQSVFSNPASTSSALSSPSRCSSSPSPSGGFSPTASGSATSVANPVLPLLPMTSEELNWPAMRSSLAPLESSIQRRLNMPKLESTLLLQTNAKPTPNLPCNSGRRSTFGAPNRRPLQTGTDFPSSSRPPLVVDSTTPTSAPAPTTMPPPRETKTLASVREKLRAKRLIMSQQQPSQSLLPKVIGREPLGPSFASASLADSTPLPPPPPSSTTGSLTPNLGTSFQGDFYTCPIATEESVPTESASVMQPPAALNQPTGNSVSAPATPQHGSPLANFKRACVVVTPSRSGSSVSSNEGAPEVTDQDHQLPDVNRQPQVQQIQQQQKATIENSPTPQQSLQQQLVAVPAGACGVGGGTTTTRAFFVDGNNLSETLALLQSINPRATVTQQQFLLIPSTDKSHAILCRTPIAIQPKQQTPQQPPIIRRHSSSAYATNNCPSISTSATPTVLPLILPANRSQDHHHQQQQQQQQVLSIPPGLYREILPNNNNNANMCGVRRLHQSTPLQPQQPAQLRPAQTYFSLLAPSSVTTSGVNSNHSNASSNNLNSSTSNNNPPTSFLPPS